jgi:hypothetical protein
VESDDDPVLVADGDADADWLAVLVVDDVIDDVDNGLVVDVPASV